MDKFFHISERGSNVRTEIMAGLTTFFAMAYIVLVNPNPVVADGKAGWLVAEGASAAEVGRVWNAVFIASVLVAVIGTLLMAFLARMPYAQACGMGLNSFFCTSFVSGNSSIRRIRAMAKNGCRIGGEQSGHIIFSKYASTGDGILTSLKMMEVMLAKKKPMSELAAPLKIYPQVLENVRVTDKKAAQNDPAVQEAVNKVAETLGDTGRILVRESGTEPVVRVMVEAPDHDTCQKYVDEVVNVICEKGYKA